jgi:hypothetical protein
MKAINVSIMTLLIVSCSEVAVAQGENGITSPRTGSTQSRDQSFGSKAILIGEAENPFITSPGTGPNGEDESLVQDQSLSLQRFGFTNGMSDGSRVADDFAVPEGEIWQIDRITFYGLQELGYVIGFQKQTSGFESVNLQIWDGPPNDPSSVPHFADGYLTCSYGGEDFSTGWTNALRLTESDKADPDQNDAREIMEYSCDFHSPLVLTSGSYWLDWQAGVDLYYAVPEAVPVTILGVAETGNGLHFNGTVWESADDGEYQQGFAFDIEGQAYVMGPPTELQVLNADSTQVLYRCGESQARLPENIDVRPSWRETYLEGVESQQMADGYQHQLFAATTCSGTPDVDEVWSIWDPPWNGPTEDGVYFFEIPNVSGEPYCWRVRGWLDLTTPGLVATKQADEFFGAWSDCCCFVVECEPLRTPTITGVGDASCGGSTHETSPFLKWRNVDNNRGYRWEITTLTGNVMATGIAGPNVNIANIGPLTEGSYVARVQARGDGSLYCDSDWSASCAFGIGEGPGPGPEAPDFTWWPEGPKAGEAVRFAELSGGVPRSWFWDFGDGTTSTQQHPVHVFGEPGTYTVTRDVELDTGHVIDQKTITVAGSIECGNNSCESGETAWSCPADCALEDGQSGRVPIPDRRPSVPAVAGGVRGAKSTFWTTEGWVFNPGPEMATFVAEFTERGQSQVYQAGPFHLEPQLGMYWANVVEELFGTTGSGALWIDSDTPVLLTTRTQTTDDDGSYGQSFDGIPERFTIREADGVVYLIGLREDARFRSNLYFQEIDGSPITVQVNVFSGDGQKIGGDTFDIQGHSMRQKNLRMHFGIADVSSAFAAVSVTEGDGRLATAASYIDQITGDPTSIDMIHPVETGEKAAGEVHELVAAVTHTRGVMGSVWKSELTIFNQTATDQGIQMTYIPEFDSDGSIGSSMQTSVTVPAGEQLRWDDVIPDVFGVQTGARTQGSLHIYTSAGPDELTINSRPYNQRSDGGTLGLLLPALSDSYLIVQGKTGTMSAIKHSSGTRTNLGFAEYTGIDTEISIVLADTEGNFTWLHDEPLQLTVPGGSHIQLTKVFERLGVGEVEYRAVQAFVQVSQGGSVYAYATVIDNGTGDATSILTAKSTQ